MSKAGIVVVGLVALALLGSCSGRERGAQGGALGRAAQQAFLCTNTLMLLDKGDTAAAQRLLRTTLLDSVEQAGELTRSGVRPKVPMPNLADGMRRASDYLAHSDPQAAQTAAKVADSLRGN